MGGRSLLMIKQFKDVYFYTKTIYMSKGKKDIQTLKKYEEIDFLLKNRNLSEEIFLIKLKEIGIYSTKHNYIKSPYFETYYDNDEREWKIIENLNLHLSQPFQKIKVLSNRGHCLGFLGEKRLKIKDKEGEFQEKNYLLFIKHTAYKDKYKNV